METEFKDPIIKPCFLLDMEALEETHPEAMDVVSEYMSEHVSGPSGLVYFRPRESSRQDVQALTKLVLGLGVPMGALVIFG